MTVVADRQTQSMDVDEDTDDVVAALGDAYVLPLDASAPFPPGCLVFVRNVHPETNKTTLKTLFSAHAFGRDSSAASSSSAVAIDYVDYNKGMTSVSVVHVVSIRPRGAQSGRGDSLGLSQLSSRPVVCGCTVGRGGRTLLPRPTLTRLFLAGHANLSAVSACSVTSASPRPTTPARSSPRSSRSRSCSVEGSTPLAVHPPPQTQTEMQRQAEVRSCSRPKSSAGSARRCIGTRCPRRSGGRPCARRSRKRRRSVLGRTGMGSRMGRGRTAQLWGPSGRGSADGRRELCPSPVGVGSCAL